MSSQKASIFSSSIATIKRANTSRLACTSSKSSSRDNAKLSRANFVRVSIPSVMLLLISPNAANAAEELMKHNEQASTFYQDWPNAQPSDIIAFVTQKATRGDPKSILHAMDEFWSFYPTYNLGKVKQEILRDVERECKPIKLIEFGTFLGYSAIATMDESRENGTLEDPEFLLVCVEAEPLHAEVAVTLLEYAGFDETKVKVITGSANASVPEVKRLLKGQVADQVFMDHCKPCLKPDLVSLEEAGMIQKGTVVIADNVIYPGAPDFLAYLDANGYTTELKEAPFEYDRSVWDKSWTKKDDAVSVSVKL
ncbi:unnamed protein product [Bathycoccus prasinos]|mmetsp:Transcript_2863/g.9327  ORF Transcript_2863/g.9327 Transcript_2863/m.9327 type:complete len:310 (-) Transcript_2863:3961-4890(-)